MGKMKAMIMDDPSPWDEIAAAEYSEWCEQEELKQVNALIQEIQNERE